MKKQKELMLHKIAAKYIMSEDIDIELSGKKAEINALFELLEVSKKLKDLLDSKTSTLREINDTLTLKKEKTENFTNLSGIVWRL
mgnify:CR=1 FL=1